jgi:integrase
LYSDEHTKTTENLTAAINLSTRSDQAQFHDFDQYERLLIAALRRGMEPYLMVLLGGDAGLRLGEILALEWRDIELTSRRLTVQRSDWLGHVTVPKGGRSRQLPMTRRLTAALKSARHLRSDRVLCLSDGSAMTRDRVIKAVRGVQRVAGVDQGVHILRHTFCSHLAMKGAPARAIQELASHADLSTTQRYMHLSPAATEDAIRLLDGRETGTEGVEKFGDILDTREAASGNICEGGV